jgi:hypothetical protein
LAGRLDQVGLHEWVASLNRDIAGVMAEVEFVRPWSHFRTESAADKVNTLLARNTRKLEKRSRDLKKSRE